MKLPCDECKGKCCTYPLFTAQEYNTVKALKGIPENTVVSNVEQLGFYDPKVIPGRQAYILHLKNGNCPYLADGKCSIYNLRPKVCRDYGMTWNLPCEYLYPEASKHYVDNIMGK